VLEMRNVFTISEGGLQNYDVTAMEVETRMLKCVTCIRYWSKMYMEVAGYNLRRSVSCS
jgi:hypothetical protein